MNTNSSSENNPIFPEGGAMHHPNRRRYLAGPAAALSILAAGQLACAIGSVDVQVGATPPPSVLTQTAKAAAAPQAEQTAPADLPTTAAETAQPAGGGIPGGFACFGTVLNGFACLTSDGWKTYTTDNTGLLDDTLRDMAVCPDGILYAATTSELASFDGSRWESIPVAGEKYKGADFVACGAEGSIWVGYYQGVARYRDGEWQTFSSAEYDTGEFSGLIHGLELAPDGTVWVAASNSVSAYDGSAWKEYKQGDGFPDEISPEGLAIDSKGRVWTADFNNVYRFENGGWTAFEMDNSVYSTRSLVVDPKDRLWINTSDRGSLLFDGSDWRSLSFAGGEIDGNGVNMAAFDSGGRTWLALTYGIDVIDGDKVTHYRMDNADLPENDLRTVAVSGAGPALPAFQTKDPGSLSGRITRGGKPLADAEMEICVETLAMFFTGKTPCSDQPFFRQIRTDGEGKFSSGDLPTGYYVIAVKLGEEWAALGELASKRILVEAGKDTDIGEITVKTDQ
jgi:hypothetical protein